MYRKRITFDYEVYESMFDLPLQDRLLMEAAISARDNAYAPYSGFKVGAAVLLDNEEVVIGNNQENASFPSGLCAERVAVFQAGARFPGIALKAIAISAASDRILVDKPAAPCGNCRQAIAEYEQRQHKGIAILMSGTEGEVFRCRAVADLLPFAFGPDNLE
jgi:cytidine deaminase